MLDIGSWEFLIIAIIALIVIGPKDLPGVVRTVSQWVRRAKDLAREFAKLNPENPRTKLFEQS